MIIIKQFILTHKQLNSSIKFSNYSAGTYAGKIYLRKIT